MKNLIGTGAGLQGSALRGASARVLGLALSVALMACGGELPAGEEQELETAENALQSCNAPINAHADWIAATRDGQHWCTGCSYVSAQVLNTATGQTVLNYWAGVDHVTTRFYPGFCYGGTCWPPRTVKTIDGTWYGYIAVDQEGVVSFDLNGTRVRVTPNFCAPDSSGTTLINGMGSDNQPYQVRLTNTWFS